MELVIAQTANDISSLKKIISHSTDILVFSQEVMISLDENDLKYKVIEDFYSMDQYFIDVSNYRKKAENFLNKLDKICDKELSFPFSYSGNEQYFLIRFDDLFYLENLLKVINKKYKKIYLYSARKPIIKKENHLDYSRFNSRRINGTISFAIERSPNKIIDLIYNSITISFLEDKKSFQKKIPPKYIFQNFYYRFILNLKTNFNIKSLFKRKKINSDNKTIFIINDGYELTYIKKYLPKYKYLNPTTKIRQEVQSDKPQNVSNIHINDVLRSFIDNNFTYLKDYMYLFMNSYHFEIVGRINSFKNKFEFNMKKYNPNLVLLSSGTRDVFDTVCCYISNKYRIPIVNFQHGGSSTMYNSPYAKALEYNSRIFKILIAQSKKDFYKNHNKFTKVLSMGSIKEFENNQVLKKKSKLRKVLYCLGPDTNMSFRSFYTVKQKYNYFIDVMSAINKSSLSIDVKLHPSGEEGSFHSHMNIIKNNEYKNINIIYGNFIELISNKYDLIIIDFMGSTIVKHLMCLKVPIIIYGSNFKDNGINDSVMDDIYSRFHIAENENELFDLLDMYKKGKLHSKWSEQIIDDYVYPLDKGNPGENIARYLESLSFQGYDIR